MPKLPAIALLLSIAVAAWGDDERAAQAGLRKISGRHLTLYTDVPGEEVERLPAVFDQAVPQWRQYFGLSSSKCKDWRVTGCLMADRKKFEAAGLLPKELPDFRHGYSMGNSLWLFDQPTDYYRRELLLHEGTHCFMFTQLGSCGPPWYMEGMAEYLGTHRLDDGQLTLGYLPRSREESPGWGRVRAIQDAVAGRRALKLEKILAFSPTAHRENEPYAWCWATVTLLDRHPRYRDRFRRLVRFVDQPDFNERFRRLFEPDWQPLCEEWQLMAAHLEYGYDVERSAVDFTPGRRVPLAEKSDSSKSVVTVVADRGWQNAGLKLEAGKTYRLRASGRYQIANVAASPKNPEKKIWWCEPGGVSIRYYQGRPLGQLLAAVRPDHPPPGSTTALLRATPIGLGAKLSPSQCGTLFLKINDSPAELSDNAGELKVEVFPE